MSTVMNTSMMKEQINSRRNILLLYIFLGVVVWGISVVIDEAIYPPSAAFVGVIALAVIFYLLLGSFVINPQLASLNNLRTLFYIFIVAWIIAISFAVWYWDGLYYTTFLGGIIAVAGIVLMYQIITDCQLLFRQPAVTPGTMGTSMTTPSPTQVSATRPQFCPACGTSLANVSATNFCPNCGQKI